MNNQLKGFLYEEQIRDYIINNLQNPAYLWKDVPEKILLKYNIIGSHNENRLNRKEDKLNPLPDTGIDVIQIEGDDCSIVQCKNGYDSGIKMSDLAGFMCWKATLDTFKGYIYYTSKLSHNIMRLPKNKKIEYIKQPFIDTAKSDNQIINNQYNAHDYQIMALNKFTEHFSTYNRGILSMPCGTGKTFTSYLISNNYKQVIIISPLKQFAKQNLDKYIEYGYKNKNLLVDSDGERDVNIISKFIKDNESFLLSSTFQSVDCIQEILEYCTDPLIIIDEFHNLSKNNITCEDDPFYQILNSEHCIMFMSATPRVYELEEDIYEENVFGEIFYNMTFTEAIEKKFITDYKIWLPAIHEANLLLNEDLSIYEIIESIKAKCKFLFSCLLNNGSKKCIIYCQDINEIDNMIEAMNKLNDYFCIEFETHKITSINTEMERSKILKDFSESSKIQLLFSVRILDECIDIPSCDSIYITYPSKSKIRTIQRLSRCIRINKLNPFKIGNIFIWCNEYDEILDTLSGIKEYDIFFKDKIAINEINFYGSKDEKIYIEIDNEQLQSYIIDIKEVKQITWDDKLNMVKKYIDEYKKLPDKKSNDKYISMLGKWVAYNKLNYKTKLCLMKDINIYNKWESLIKSDEYSEYFVSSEGLFYKHLNLVIKYIDDNEKLPTSKSKEDDIRHLAAWITMQKINYKNIAQSMKIKNVYDRWTSFINDAKYGKYLLTIEEIWSNNLKKMKKYIDDNNILPSKTSENNDIRYLRGWINEQKKNYKNKKGLCSKRDEWTAIINDDKYKKFFQYKDVNEKWLNTLEKLKKYIDDNSACPTATNPNNDIKKLGTWLSTQKKKYKTKTGLIFSKVEFYNKWTSFINDDKYKKFFQYTNNDIWLNNLNKLKKYIDDNSKRPNPKDHQNNDTKKLGKWLYTQKSAHKKGKINDKWIEFINNPIYHKYFFKKSKISENN